MRDLEQFTNENRLSAGNRALELVWAQQAMQQTRSHISQPEGKPWLIAVAADSRSQHRQLGQRLMGLTLQHVSANSNHHLLLEEARTVGEAYGRLARADGLSLTDPLSAALFFRDMLVETALSMAAVWVESADNLRLVHRISEMMNAVRLAITRAYE